MAGILAEAREGRVVLGIGINVNVAENELPTEVDRPATSLLVETDRELDRRRAAPGASRAARARLRRLAWLGPANLPALVTGRIAEERPQRTDQTAMTDAEKAGTPDRQNMGAPVQDDGQPAGLAEPEPQQA